jgi:hypothetical protein
VHLNVPFPLHLHDSKDGQSMGIFIGLLHLGCVVLGLGSWKKREELTKGRRGKGPGI